MVYNSIDTEVFTSLLKLCEQRLIILSNKTLNSENKEFKIIS